MATTHDGYRPLSGSSPPSILRRAHPLALACAGALFLGVILATVRRIAFSSPASPTAPAAPTAAVMSVFAHASAGAVQAYDGVLLGRKHGRKHRHKHRKHKRHDDDEEDWFDDEEDWVPQKTPHPVAGAKVDCADPMYAKKVLKVVDEYPIARMVFDDDHFAAAKGLEKFEASDVAGVPGAGNPYFVVLDNSFKIFRVGPTISIAEGHGNNLLSWPDDSGEGSQFECLAYNMTSSSFIAVQEMITHADGAMKAHIFDVSFGDDAVVVERKCECDYEFAKDNKGFEGAIVATASDGESYLLALCEGNHCRGGKKGRDTGNGVLVVLKRGERADGVCEFQTVGQIALPKSCDFMDYSAITVNQALDVGKDGQVTIAVASQENSAIWVGTMKPATKAGEFFEFGEGKVHFFPPDDACHPIYCNIEGIHFTSERSVIAVSDAMKKGGKQDYRCWNKAQSVHLMAW